MKQTLLVCSVDDRRWALTTKRDAQRHYVSLETLVVTRSNIKERLSQVGTGSYNRVVFAPSHGILGRRAGVSLSRDYNATPYLIGEDLAVCDREMMRIAAHEVIKVTCHQGKREQMRWWGQQVRSEQNEGKHIGGFNYAILDKWSLVDRWIASGSRYHGLDMLKGYIRHRVTA